MCFDERWTESRARSPAAALMARRTLAWRRAAALRLWPISSSRSFLLAFLAEDVLARVFHALAFVRLGRTEGADLGRYLSDLLTIDPADHDFGRPRCRDRNPFGNRVLDFMAE